MIDGGLVLEVLRGLACSVETDDRFRKRDKEVIRNFLATKLPEDGGFLYEIVGVDGSRHVLETRKAYASGDVAQLESKTKKLGFLPSTETQEWKVVKPITSLERVFFG